MYIPIVSSLISSIGSFFTERQKIKAAQRERSDILREKKLDAKITAIKNAQEADIEMDVNGRNIKGWMDDVSFAAFLAPAILAFFPSMVPHVEAGFRVLETMPLWYQYSLGAMLVSVWGYRRLVTPIVEIIVEKWVSRIPKIK
jgi:hypothetical protein